MLPKPRFGGHCCVNNPHPKGSPVMNGKFRTAFAGCFTVSSAIVTHLLLIHGTDWATNVGIITAGTTGMWLVLTIIEAQDYVLRR